MLFFSVKLTQQLVSSPSTDFSSHNPFPRRLSHSAEPLITAVTADWLRTDHLPLHDFPVTMKEEEKEAQRPSGGRSVSLLGPIWKHSPRPPPGRQLIGRVLGPQREQLSLKFREPVKNQNLLKPVLVPEVAGRAEPPLVFRREAAGSWRWRSG